MRRFLLLLFVFGFVLSLGFTAQAEDVNVAEGKEVTLNGTFFLKHRFGPAVIPSDPQERADTLTDGVFLSRSTSAFSGTVWWDAVEPVSVNNYITIDLGASYTLESLVIQADDNDAYYLDYWDGDSWERLWAVPNYNNYGWGMQTRPDPAHDIVRYDLSESVTTSMLKFTGNLASGDKLFSVSEIQAYGTVTPEPVSSVLFFIGSAFLGWRTSRRKPLHRL